VSVVETVHVQSPAAAITAKVLPASPYTGMDADMGDSVAHCAAVTDWEGVAGEDEQPEQPRNTKGATTSSRRIQLSTVEALP
jgi:hypothetical protein